MPSLKSRCMNFMIRNRHILRGKLHKPRFDMHTSIPDFRRECEEGAARYAAIPKAIRVQPERVNRIAAEWLIPELASPDKCILYVHGGGYVSGSCSDHRGFVSRFAAQTGYRTLVFEYRLAPEHPFPAALEDSVTVYRALLDRGFRASDILLAGESAGGGLALALLLALKEEKLPLPSAAVAITPWTDLTCSSESYTTRNKRSVAPLNSWHVFSRHYAGGHSPTDPLMSPLFGDPAGLPPLFINAGTDDELFEDGVKFAEKAEAAGVDVTFRAGEGMVHCYPLLAPMFREAVEAMEEITAFIRKHLG